MNMPASCSKLARLMRQGFAGAVQLWYLKAKDCIPPLGMVRMILNEDDRPLPSYIDDDSNLMWLSVQLEKDGWVPPFGDNTDAPTDNFPTAVLHFFPMEVQSDEAKANLAETQEPPCDDPNIARSKVFKTSGIMQPIDLVAHRVAKQPHDTLDYRQVPCPKCGALAGEYCKSASGKRANYHSARKQIHNDRIKGVTV